MMTNELFDGLQLSACLPPDPGYDIFVVPGQSNSVGQGLGSFGAYSGPAGYDNRLFQIGRFGGGALKVIPADEPLQFWDNELGTRHSFATPLMRLYAARLPGCRKVLLVPAARGQTSIFQWLNDGILWPDFLVRLDMALRTPGKPRVVAWFENQIEADINNFVIHSGPDATAYHDAKLVLIDRFRALCPDVPMFFGDPVEEWRNGQTAKNNFVASLHTAISERDRCYSVGTAGFPSNTTIDPGESDVHFCAEGLGQLAYAYWDAFEGA